MTAITEQITNPSVIAAVHAKFRQRRSYSEHWNCYMNHDERLAFTDNCAAFIEACEARQRWLTQYGRR